MRKHTLLSPLLAAAFLGCGYVAPLDPNAPDTPLNVISGTILFAGDEPPSQTVVFIFDATNPPPPVGTGRPVTFSTVPGEAFTDEDVNGLRSAPFAVPYLEDTTAENGLANGYLVTAVMDQDDNYVPLPTVAGLGGSTWGDWLGTYVTDLTTLQTAPLFVEGGELLDNVTVIVGNRQPIQRPGFTTVGDVVMDKAKGADSISPSNAQTYRVRSSPIHTSYGDEITLDLPGPCPPEPGATDCASTALCRCDATQTDPSETAFWIWFVDQLCEFEDIDGDGVGDTEAPIDPPVPCAAGDGRHDPYPAEIQAANDIKNVYPRIYIEYLGEPAENAQGPYFVTNPLGTFEFEGPDGTNTVPERWVGENFPLAYELRTLGASSLAPAGATFQPFPANEMSVTWSPVLRHYHAGGTFAVDPANGPYDLLDLRCARDEEGNFPEPGAGLVVPTYCEETGEVTPDMIPSGAWRITVVTHTGQTWTVPNEIGMPGLAQLAGFEALQSTSADFDVASQSMWLTME